MSVIGGNKVSKVEVKQTSTGYSILRDGHPLVVKGAGGWENIELLAKAGANALRTWGSEQTEMVLPDVRKCQINLCSGLWMVPPRQKFDYSDKAAVQAQKEQILLEVVRYKDEPQLLIWGLGNELDLGSEFDPRVWEAVEDLAQAIKRIDPNHPVMTVLSCPNLQVLEAIDRICPSLDLVGINAYGDIGFVGSAMYTATWKKPYIVTEWGANGSWEVLKTDWGAEIEPTSHQKAAQIRERYNILQSKGPGCLGNFVFLWGNKQETTPTWFGFFDTLGNRYESVEVLGELWAGEWKGDRACRISELQVDGQFAATNFRARPGQSLRVEFGFVDDSPPANRLRWQVLCECCDKREGGDLEKAPDEVDCSIRSLEGHDHHHFIAPKNKGAYRLYLYAYGPSGTVATANFPFLVE